MQRLMDKVLRGCHLPLTILMILIHSANEEEHWEHLLSLNVCKELG